MAIPTTLADAYQPVQPQLDQVRAAIEAFWTEALQLVHGPDMTPPAMGGKLMRPALTLLSAGMQGADDLDRYVELATAYELLHLAALTHDDVVDSAHIRRGVSSLNALWDNHAAVLGGDYLVARAILLLSRYDSCPLLADAVESVRQMAEGELSSLGRAPDSFSDEACIRLAEQKTASLFASACAGPTFLIDATHRDALRRYGMGFGVAFQLADDLLDLSQTEAKLGKPACGDIVEGKPTLPIRHMRKVLTPDEQARLDAMKDATISDADRTWIAEALERTGARAHTETVAQRHIDDAQAALDTLPASDCREAMTKILGFVLVRGA